MVEETEDHIKAFQTAIRLKNVNKHVLMQDHKNANQLNLDMNLDFANFGVVHATTNQA